MLNIVKHIQKHENCRLCVLDPRTKLISMILAIIAIIMIQSEDYNRFTFFFAWLTSIIFLSHKSFGFYLKRILQIYPMIFFMTILLPFTRTNISQDLEIVYSLYSINIYHDGIITFFDINIRSILIFTSSLILISETSLTAMLKTLSVLHIPKWIEAILIYMHRFIHLIASEFSRMHLAFSARSFNMSIFDKTKAIAKMSGVYFSRLIDRSERSHIAMISRGFTGEIYTWYQLKWRGIDTGIVLFNFAFLSILIFGWTN